MYFKDYKDASERHLATCLNIFERIYELEIKRNDRGITQKDLKLQNRLLENLYYLSGYMLECLYNYTICKKEGIPDNLHINLLDRAPNYGKYNICFNYTKKNTNIRYSLVRKAHNMTLSDLAYLDSHSNTENIPLIHNNLHFTDINSQILFDNWSVFERYKINHNEKNSFPNGINTFPFNFFNISKFFWEIVDVCFKLSKFITKENTLFLNVIKKRPSNI